MALEMAQSLDKKQWILWRSGLCYIIIFNRVCLCRIW